MLVMINIKFNIKIKKKKSKHVNSCLLTRPLHYFLANIKAVNKLWHVILDF